MSEASFYSADPWLKPFTGVIEERISRCKLKEKHLAGNGSLSDFAVGYLYYGLHRTESGWIFREWAPNATDIYLTGTFSGWKEASAYRMSRINAYGDWEIKLPQEALNHGDLFKLLVHWTDGK
ncbi:MAG: 1,4-alpha-glucan-branching enzyme, partial [Bacteroidales bacterium]